MNKRLIAFLISVVVFTLVFYKKSVGINLVIYETTSFLLLLFITDFKRSAFSYLFLAGTFLTLLSSLWHYSSLSFTLNYISFFLLVTTMLYDSYKSMTSILLQAIKNIFSAQFSFIKGINNKKGGTKFWYKFNKIGYFIFPVVIIVVFISLYSVSSFDFSKILNKTVNYIAELFEMIPSIKWALFGVILLAIFFGSFIFYSKKDDAFIYRDSILNDELKRTKKRRFAKPLAFLYEYKSAIFLFTVLNLLILIVNISDIWNVWINFTWSGQFLKEFVHTGTYTLIFSILISMGLVIYYFRNNLNFFSKNKPLIILTNIWILQNALLVISVCVRNLRYIEHFALAYKRIGVFFFLIATLYGLYTVFIKVNKKKSFSFLSRKNTLSIYLVLVFMSLFNWDLIIINYNVKHADRSFLHFNYLSLMSNQCLPELNKNKAFWDEKKVHQKKRFSFGSSSSYMQPKEFMTAIDERILLFTQEYPNRSWLEWNYGDWKAYKKFTE